MKLFIDTANLDEIKEINEMGLLNGVTTNPTLMAKVGVKGEKAVVEHYRKICEMVDGDISAEVTTVDFQSMIDEGQKLAAIHPNIVVKIPMIKDGVKAIKWLTDKGIRVNTTLVFSAGQAILAEASLSYLGLGVQEPTPAWGLMLQGGAEEYASTAPWIAGSALRAAPE